MKKTIIIALLLITCCVHAQDVKNASVIFSKDGGINWTDGDEGLPKDVIVTSYIAIAKTIFIGTEINGLFRFQQGTWSPIKSVAGAGRINAIIGADDKLYISSDARGVLVSNDAGDTWKNFNDNLPSDKIRRFFSVNGKLIAGGNDGIYSSTGGSPWVKNASNVQVHKFIRYCDKLYAATSTGIYCSADNGETWQVSWRHRPVLDFSIQKNKLVALLDDSNVATLLDNNTWQEVTPFLKYLYTVHLTPLSRPVLRHDFQSPMIRNAQFHPLIMFRDTSAPTYMLDTPEGLMLIVWLQMVGC